MKSARQIALGDEKDKSGFVTPSIQITRVTTQHPWGDVVSVNYVCGRLVAGYAYKVTFYMTVNGQEKSWTIDLPISADVSYPTYNAVFSTKTEDKFGTNKRDRHAKIRATIQAVAE